MSQYGRAAVPPAAGSVFVLGVVAVVGAFLVAQGLTSVSYNYTMGAVAALNLIARTPLNWAILSYVATNLVATMLGYMTGGIGSWSGYFYVLKYVEYFVIYYMAVNNLRDRQHAWRLVTAAFITAAIVSLVGAAQVPSGERVSAPFEGETGEPNTFGGYLLFMMAIAGAIGLETETPRRRLQWLAVLGLMAGALFFSLSRAPYVGVIPPVL